MYVVPVPAVAITQFVPLTFYVGVGSYTTRRVTVVPGANMAGVVKIGTPLNRTKNMALLMQARNTGMALGPAVGGLLGSLVSMQAAFAGVGLGLAGSALVFGRIYRDVAPGDQKPIDPPLQLFRTAFVSWREALTTVPLVGALCVMSAVANGSLAGTNMTLLPLLLCDELGLGTGAIGSMLAANAVVGAVTGGQMGALAHRVGPRLAIGAGATQRRWRSEWLPSPLSATPPSSWARSAARSSG